MSVNEKIILKHSSVNGSVMKKKTVHRGEIYYLNLGYQPRAVQSGVRPVLIVQNDVGNYYSDTVIVSPITSQIKKLNMPTHVLLMPGCTGLKALSMVMLEQLITVEKTQLLERIGNVCSQDLKQINQAICISMGVKAQNQETK